MRGVFVTGTGTGVGKTVLAASLARSLARSGKRISVFKPALSGLSEGGMADHHLLRWAAGSSQSEAEIAPYRYPEPVSPHLGAELAGETIDTDALLRAARRAGEAADILICEGVGGLLVPLRADYLVRDFARELGFPLLLAAPPSLGTINHTLLSLESARAAALEVRSVVFTPWPNRPSRVELSNRETIERLGEVRVETLPRLDGDPGRWPQLPSGLVEELARPA